MSIAALIDSGIENYAPEVFINSDINDILAYGMVPILRPDGLHTYTVGPKGGGALWHIARPLQRPSGKLSWQFDYTPSPEILLDGQCLEFDCRITDANGITYPCDMQINLARGGMVQLAVGVKANNISWQDTGVIIPLSVFNAGTKTTIRWDYVFDPVAEVCDVPSLGVGQTTYTIPTTLPGGMPRQQPGAPIGWDRDEAVIQKQHDLSADHAGCMHDCMSNIQLIYY